MLNVTVKAVSSTGQLNFFQTCPATRPRWVDAQVLNVPPRSSDSSASLGRLLTLSLLTVSRKLAHQSPSSFPRAEFYGQVNSPPTFLPWEFYLCAFAMFGSLRGSAVACNYCHRRLKNSFETQRIYLPCLSTRYLFYLLRTHLARFSNDYQRIVNGFNSYVSDAGFVSLAVGSQRQNALGTTRHCRL
jgi:hypothetical protein